MSKRLSNASRDSKISLNTELLELLRFARQYNTGNWDDPEELQGGLNAFLASISGSRTVFQVYTMRNEAIIQVIGETKLQPDFRRIAPLDLDTMQGELPLYPWPKNVIEVPIDWSTDQQLHIMFIDPPSTFSGENAIILVDNFLGVCACTLWNSFKLQEETRAKDRCQLLMLHSNWMLSNLGDIVWLGGEALMAVRRMTEAECGILFILTTDRNSLEIIGIDPPDPSHLGAKVPVAQTFEGYLVSSTNAVRAENTAGNKLFYSKVDELMSRVPRNVLAFPLKDGTNETIGGVKLSNKAGGFTKLDEDSAAQLAALCGSALLHGALHTRMRQGNARAMVSTALLNHVRNNTVIQTDLQQTIEGRHHLDQATLANLTEFTWNSREASPSDSLAMSMVMLEQLHIFRLVRTKRITVATFLTKVQAAYRPVAYHNWSHAFSVAHFIYCLIYRLDLVSKGWLTELEAVAFFIAALCHDVDHRGTTNSFHVKIRSDLGKLYGSEGSIMERHHFSQTLELIGSEGSNIFQSMDPKQYREILEFIRDRILDTDLVLHLTTWGERKKFLSSLAQESLREYRGHVLPIMMTSADLCDMAKEWKVTRDCAAGLYKELFAQGDIERAMGYVLAPMIDREKVNIVEMQYNFMKDIVLPCYTLLGQLFPVLEYVIRAMEDCKDRWDRTRSFYANGRTAGRPPIEIINDPAFTAIATSS